MFCIGGITPLLTLPAFLTSNYAVLGYILILLISLVVLVITLMVKEGNKTPTEYKIVGEIETDVKISGDSESQSTLSKKKEDTNGPRFCMLNDIEKKKSKIQRESYDKNITLDEFCDDFRNFAASKLKLYYDISDIRKFVSGMAVSHILILQGMSGTGKTSLAHAFGNFIDNPSTVIPVQPMWKERTDIIGYYNEFTKKFN